MTTRGEATPCLCGVPAKWCALAMMVLQHVGVIVMARISRTRQDDGPLYLNTTVVFFSECVKLVCSLAFLIAESGSESAWLSLKEHITHNPAELMRASVPGLLYCVNNNLLFIGISNLSAAVFQVTSQLKILSTTVLSVLTVWFLFSWIVCAS
eukprot:TRINITY_DN23954_c0_g1_i2.p1 TRINITY_DN23954_c0_g1~~TRINITY_DN23954_c0_g1_i2.p1  ORF type:complete len:153 (-),score=4.48 TRINITY_DN23954_c0_g1_i2:1059-1517(-)